MINFFKKMRQKKQRALLETSILLGLNDLEAAVKVNSSFSAEDREAFKNLDNLRQLVKSVQFDQLEGIAKDLSDLKQAMLQQGIQETIISNFFDITNKIYGNQDFKGISSMLNLSLLQAEWNRAEQRMQKLKTEILARGGQQYATPMQKKEWVRLAQRRESLNNLMYIVDTTIQRADVKASLERGIKLLNAYDPKFKPVTITEKMSVEDLKKINLEYQARLRQLEEERISMGSIGSASLQDAGNMELPGFNDVQASQSVKMPETNTCKPVSVDATINTTDEMTPRELRSSLIQVNAQLQNCAKELEAKHSERTKQDECMKDLLLQYKNMEGNPAAQEMLKNRIHSLDAQRKTLKKTIEMWQNAQSQLNNIQSMLTLALESKQVQDVQVFLNSLGFSSIEGLAMKIKESIEKMNEDLKNNETAMHVADSVDVETGYLEEIPTVNTAVGKDAKIEALMDEFKIDHPKA